ncbi:hypothetical protein J7I97_32090 [Streptomyces sp. ISL-87]|uniref:hypothetical protein n=1 Tax=Streptomyces sp. ISL-87 TaxID=2819188 RepID=UPI001BE83460|nr:hypothetical protein [Streptomyces sp. ISL-87]MBT2612738.1 hypothetical protein [Streptomyces sp. ISL-87]
MSTAVRPRIARAYTSARRHPWVLGKIGDWTVWFGPYTPAQLVVLGGGAFALIKGYDWWSWAGPVPVVLWLGSVWGVRGAQIAGQNPFTAVLGAFTLLLRHPAGRIAGRVARDKRASRMRARFVIQPAPAASPHAALVKPASVTGRAAGPRAAMVKPARVAGRAAGGSGLARLLADADKVEGRAA